MLELMINQMKDRADTLTAKRMKEEAAFRSKQSDRAQRRQARRNEFQSVLKMCVSASGNLARDAVPITAPVPRMCAAC